MKKIICGIQQIGIGVPNVEKIWSWYRKNFGINIKIFEEAAEAPLMIRYTGNQVQSRTATLALSMNGGGGFEIWKYTSRETKKAEFNIQLGDYGLFAAKIKTRNIQKTYQFYKDNGVEILNKPCTSPDKTCSFFVKDPHDNVFQIVESNSWFSNTKHASFCGGPSGVIIGVSNMDKSLILYQEILEYDKIVYDITGEFEDLNNLPGYKGKYRRIKLKHSKKRQGPFSELLGASQIELIQSLDRIDCKKIFQDRYWGDWGFIHLCFDIQKMDLLKKECEDKGFPFTVDSANSFDMGEAAGRFSYIEDPDGTWIEFVETHKVPIIKKIGWYLNLKNRKAGKNLPRFILKAMGLNKVK